LNKVKSQITMLDIQLYLLTNCYILVDKKYYFLFCEKLVKKEFLFENMF
jgi:hypothetical protein